MASGPLSPPPGPVERLKRPCLIGLREWTWSSRYAFYVAKSLHGDLEVRFIDLNGDGKIDMVYHRWINQHTQKKGAYLNNGNGWIWSPQYTPPFHISANGYRDLGARFVEVNDDNKIDMVYHRWINGHTQQRGAYVNNGNGWTWAPSKQTSQNKKHCTSDQFLLVGIMFSVIL